MSIVDDMESEWRKIMVSEKSDKGCDIFALIEFNRHIVPLLFSIAKAVRGICDEEVAIEMALMEWKNEWILNKQ